jgi:C1A family cysteine protease
MRQFHLHVITLTTALTLLAGCGSSTTEQPDTLFNAQNEYGAANAPLPEGAILISQDEFKQLLDSNHQILKRQTLETNAKNHKARREARRLAIQKLLEQYPKLQRFLMQPGNLAANVTPTKDGNFSSTIQTTKGARKIITLGEDSAMDELVEGFLRFRSRGNQESLYGLAYNALPSSEQAKHPAPNALNTLSDVQMTQATHEVSTALVLIPKVGVIPELKPAGYVSDPEQEQGRGKGLDRNDLVNCPNNFATDGIHHNFNWPLKYYTTSIKDQGGRGSCVAFAVTAALETRVALKYGQWVNLSEQRLYNQYLLDWFPTAQAFGDGADSIELLQKMDASDFIVPLERTWNYNPSYYRIEHENPAFYTSSCDLTQEGGPPYTEACSDSNHQSATSCTSDGFHTYCAYGRPSNTEGPGYQITDFDVLWNTDASADASANGFALLKTALRDKKPVVLGLLAVPSFRNPSASGYVSYVGHEDDRSSGHHAVLASGFITNSELASKLPGAQPGAGGGYVIIKNSWGACWGDAGYAYLPFSWVMDYTFRAIAVNNAR